MTEEIATSTALATTEQAAQFALSDGVYAGMAPFEAAQRIAKSLASSTLVPEIYRGQTGLANCLIALEIAGRMKLSPLTVMQNMSPVHGKPTWSSEFLIALINNCGRFTPLRFLFDKDEDPTWCYAMANDKATGEVLKGAKITLEMAKREGWLTRNGSKWQTMPDQMMRYRAASFWKRIYAPDLTMGFATQEEAIDVEPVSVKEVK